jgi:hypothetical protein
VITDDQYCMYLGGPKVLTVQCIPAFSVAEADVSCSTLAALTPVCRIIN